MSGPNGGYIPAWGTDTWLPVHLSRVKCIRCGTAMEKGPWLSSYSRVTNRFSESVAMSCRDMPIQHVGIPMDFLGTSLSIFTRPIFTTIWPNQTFQKCVCLVWTSFPFRKAIGMPIVICEPSTRRVLWVCRGRGREVIRPFFEKLGEDGRKRIQAVVMDM